MNEKTINADEMMGDAASILGMTMDGAALQI